MPPTTTGAGPLIDPPCALTLLIVSNARLVSYSQTMAPSRAEKARIAPSIDPEKTAPGIAVIAADCAPLQPRPGCPHFGGGGGVNQTRSPVASLTACNPPGDGELPSATGKYAWSASIADPHSMPPSALPLPARYCQRIWPWRSGSI